MTSPPTRTTPARPFGITDGLILIAALAAGLGASRAIEPRLTPEVLRYEIAGTLSRGFTFDAFAVIVLEYGSILAIPGWGALTLAWLWMNLRIRGARPSDRRWGQRPGTTAGLVASSVIVVCAMAGLAQIMMLRAGDFRRLARMTHIIGVGSVHAGLAVFWCWVTLAICGRWAPEPTWIDRGGRFLGATWILIALVDGYAIYRFWM